MLSAAQNRTGHLAVWTILADLQQHKSALKAHGRRRPECERMAEHMGLDIELRRLL